MVADNLTSHVYVCVFADVQIQVESSNETDGSESCVCTLMLVCVTNI